MQRENVLKKLHFACFICKILITRMLIYRRWEIMAYSEKLLDIIVLRNVKFILQKMPVHV